MNLIQICIISVMGVGLILLLKGTKPEFSYLLAMGICILLFGAAVGGFSRVLEQIQGLAAYLGTDGEYLKILVKMIGVTYLCEFCSCICKDAGQSAIAGQVELWGKLSIMAAGIPIIYGVITSIQSLIW